MSERRRIVPDNSVMVPAFFPETIEFRDNPFSLTQRAEPLADAFRMRDVEGWAPDLLVHEFVGRACEKMSARQGAQRLDLDVIDPQVNGFLTLPIVYVPLRELAERAWDLMMRHPIRPPDVWYLACAIHCDAELWISHEHEDRFAQHARQVYGNVHLLTEERFRLRGQQT